MLKQQVQVSDWGVVDYAEAWDRQEALLKANVDIKLNSRNSLSEPNVPNSPTSHHLIFCEHPPVYTLGKSGDMANVLLSDEELHQRGISFFKTNRGGDITYHGPGQIVGYPIIDLEKFTTDIGLYLRNIEEVIIRTIGQFGLTGERSAGETGVWLDSGKKGRERKICAIGVRCSRWVTMHGYALNVNTDLGYFGNIIPCGIQDKQVTSLSQELGEDIDMKLVKNMIVSNFAEVFDADMYW